MDTNIDDEKYKTGKESRHAQLNETKWDERAKTFDKKSFSVNYLRKAQNLLVSALDIREGMNFLDIGSGTGWALGQIAARVNNRGQFYGVDLSAGMIDRARDNFKGRDNFHFTKANAESIPLDSDFFDIIICTNSFHHYLNPAKALREMKRLLKPGGIVYILDPTADWWLIKIAAKIMPFFEKIHVKMYSTMEFKSLFADAGLNYMETKALRMHQKVHIGKKE